MNQITKDEEKIYRLCHQDFEGLSTQETAKRLSISQRRVEQLLQNLKMKAPQLFPILTKRQAQIEELINGQGYTYKQVANRLRLTVSTVGSVVKTLKKKGVYFQCGQEILQYNPSMDDSIIKRKF